MELALGHSRFDIATRALVMGIHGDEEQLNPPDDTPVPTGAKLIYLADKPILPG